MLLQRLCLGLGARALRSQPPALRLLLRPLVGGACLHSAAFLRFARAKPPQPPPPPPVPPPPRAALSWARLWSLVRPYWAWLLGAVLAALAVAALNVAIPLELGQLVGLIADIREGGKRPLIQAAAKLCGLYALQGLLTAVYIALLSVLGERVARDLRVELFSALVNQDVAFYDARHSGEVVARLSSDVQEFKSAFKLCVSQGLRSATQVCGSLVSMYMLSAEMTLGTALVVPLVVVCGSALGSVLRGASRRLQEQSGKVAMVADEAVSNIRTVRAFASEASELRLFTAEAEEARRQAEWLGLGIGAFQGASNLFLNGIVLGVLYNGASLIQAGQMKPGELMSFLVTAQTIQKSLGQLSILAGQAAKGWAAGGRVQEYIEAPRRMPLSGGKRIPKSELRGDITFHDVHFAYPTRPESEVLSSLSLVVPARSTVALCGPSGQGKSTVAALLERFYDVQAGAVRIDGVDIRELDPHWLRGEVIGFISQEPVLFSGTIADNIRYGKPDATAVEVAAAAEAANAHHFICKLPAGYETDVGERGARLSGGQKQRIAIARALVKQPAILILDEATSALDPHSEAKVKEALERAAAGRTVLLIAHRLTTIHHADAIAVVQGGRIAEIGSHEELMRRKGAYYRNVKNQFD